MPKRLRTTVLGHSPPGFPDNDKEFQFMDKATVNDLTKDGRILMDFLPIQDVVFP